MGSLLDNIQKRTFLPSMHMKNDLPISYSSNKDTHLIGLRRRIISSFSVKIQPFSSSASISWAALRHSNSAPAFMEEFAGGPLRRWWERSWSWLLSKKPAGFSRDLEMNEEAASKGRFRHLFHKIRSEIRKLVRSHTLPTKFRYDSISYAQNFDDGM